ncbi:939_t:CDS:2, partial [Dentiscutata heterogama]
MSLDTQKALQSNIYQSSSEAITSIYQQAFSTKTRLDGLLVMGYDDSEICKILLSNIYFHLYTFKIGNLNMIIFEIEFNNNNVIVRIYQNFQEIQIFCDTNPNSVWSKIGILVQFTGSMLFGLKHERTKSEISKELTLFTTSKTHEKVAEQFWSAFQDALDVNIREIDGKRRI